MTIKYISPFKPKKFIEFIPKNLNIYTFHAGFKRKKNDLLIIRFKKPFRISAVYTKSTLEAAPIKWDKNLKSDFCEVLIVNSGNANAFTGVKGLKEINKYITIAAKVFKCKKNKIYVSSTGIIGEQLDSNLIISKIKLIKKTKKTGLLNAAKAIMTTDTFPKIIKEGININSHKIDIYGIAKGSGMIAPNMGTMLSYIFIDTKLNKSEIDFLLKRNVENTFNSITVDGDTSTNDTVMLFSSNHDNLNYKGKRSKLIDLISKKLEKVMSNLSMQIISDGEGINKLIKVNVVKAKSKNQANKIAFAIANSILVKSAINGEDPNWGRLIMAIGKTLEKIDPAKLSIKIGNQKIIFKGNKKNFKTRELIKYMKNKKIALDIDLGVGKYNKVVWGNDLSHKYLEINSEYSS
ncbi:MAG: Arginine biosynthesis bifunctional protein ArgJ [Alphaproteobacteria bacterium MarineAlpha5_Bin9]|nr:MAG: Arginine biosynthesis bifunctional protein ArgJ [Alphaproteobacteria bacterium MarineAlpha5_Bin9]|tara:strand:- start:16481 stop:17698 length:1218 start_codon:yes stop_codon:yes gene_type:complete